MGELLSERGELEVLALLVPGGVTQLEGMVDCQLRKASAILVGSLGFSWGGVRGAEELPWEVMRDSVISSSSFTLLICVGALGCCFWKSSRASSACRSSQLTHWLSKSGYYFHLIKYWILHPLPCHLESKICSTSYSSSPLIRSGGGCTKLGPWKSISW